MGLGCTTPADMQCATTLHLSSDGSGGTTTRQPTWSFNVCVELPDGEWCFVGYIGSVVPVESHLPHWLGAECAEAEAAELLGLSWAMLYAISWTTPATQKSTMPISKVVLRFDSKVAGKSVCWSWSSTKHQTPHRVLRRPS